MANDRLLVHPEKKKQNVMVQAISVAALLCFCIGTVTILNNKESVTTNNFINSRHLSSIMETSTPQYEEIRFPAGFKPEPLNVDFKFYGVTEEDKRCFKEARKMSTIGYGKRDEMIEKETMRYTNHLQNTILNLKKNLQTAQREYDDIVSVKKEGTLSELDIAQNNYNQAKEYYAEAVRKSQLEKNQVTGSNREKREARSAIDKKLEAERVKKDELLRILNNKAELNKEGNTAILEKKQKLQTAQEIYINAKHSVDDRISDFTDTISKFYNQELQKLIHEEPLNTFAINCRALREKILKDREEKSQLKEQMEKIEAIKSELVANVKPLNSNEKIIYGCGKYDALFKLTHGYAKGEESNADLDFPDDFDEEDRKKSLDQLNSCQAAIISCDMPKCQIKSKDINVPLCLKPRILVNENLHKFTCVANVQTGIFTKAGGPAFCPLQKRSNIEECRQDIDTIEPIAVVA